MDTESFKKYVYELIDCTAVYLNNLEKYFVRSQVNPGDIKGRLPWDHLNLII